MTISKKIAIFAALMTYGQLAAAAPDDNFQQKYPDFACDVDNGVPAKFGPSYSVKDIQQLATYSMGQEQIDRVYARLTAGPMPMGEYQGTVIFAESECTDSVNTLLASMGLPSMNSQVFNTSNMTNGYVQQMLADFAAIGIKPPNITNKQALTYLMEAIWHGKVFKKDPLAVPNDETRILGNRIPSMPYLNFLFSTMKLPFPPLPPGGDPTLRFPAKVYCGESLFDTRRESIIIDYAHSETVFDGDKDQKSINYHKEIDFLASSTGLQIRDEIRMIRPGLYLGRAYMGRVFVLNFTLECKSGDCMNLPVQGGAAEACNIGAQRRTVLANPDAANQSCMSMQDFRKL